MDDEEFERAVKIAEADINKLTPDELLDQLANLETTGASELRDEAGQNLARKLWTERHQTALDLTPLLTQTVKAQNSLNGEFESWGYHEGSSRKSLR